MQRLLIIGCGDIALRTVTLISKKRYRIFALSRSAQRDKLFRQYGITPIRGDLDHPKTLDRLAIAADDVLHFAPPANSGDEDNRSRRLIAALTKGQSLPQRLVYISTTGVYGDCGGNLVTETKAVSPISARAQRRVDAERRLREWGRDNKINIFILRVPGIYAEDRLPLERLRSGTPALIAEQDVYTNHVHADDLANIVLKVVHRGKPGRVYNACDDTQLKMADYFDLVADYFDLTRPPRISLEQAKSQISESLLSFMRESRRLNNTRIKSELGVRLRYATVEHALQAMKRSES